MLRRNVLRIATRGSALALAQSNYIKSLIEKKHGILVENVVIKTTGDRILDKSLSSIGGKGLFIKELEFALLEGVADIAVHSMKDVPAVLQDDFEIFVYPDSSSPNDAFLSVNYDSIEDLKNGAIVGTSSLRRKYQLLTLRPDLVIKDLRGNVDTRIGKLKNGEYDAIILAESGLRRLNLESEIKQSIDLGLMVPAVCQGVLGIEVLRQNDKVKNIISFMDNPLNNIRVSAERAFLKTLNGGCQIPIGCHCSIIDNCVINLTGYMASTDGTTVFKDSMTGLSSQAFNIGVSLANRFIDMGASSIIDKL